jgi:hypothetical protein
VKPEIQFTPGGFILNWKPFDRYEVCTAGDCFVMDNDMDIITLSKSTVKDSGEMYGFRYSAQNDTLTLYNLLNTNPAEKGMYETKGVAYRFFRNAPNNFKLQTSKFEVQSLKLLKISYGNFFLDASNFKLQTLNSSITWPAH